MELKVKRVISETDRKLKKLKSEAIIIQQKINKFKAEKKYKRGEWSGYNNWVNGEHLDKIKFPCFCRYKHCGKRHMGEIHRRYGWYILFNIDKQLSQPKSNAVGDDNDLGRLIKAFDIHILKGKIILFDDTDDTDEKYNIDIEEEE